MDSIMSSIRIPAAAVAVVAALVSALSTAPAQDPPAVAEVDKPVRDFTLKDVSEGKEHKLSTHKGKVVVVIFYNHTCGTCPSYDGRLKKFHEAYKDKGVVMIGIDAHSMNSVEAAREQWDSKKPGFPLLKDEKGDVVTHFDPNVTPTCYVIDGKGVLRYSGAFDNSDAEVNVSKTFVKDAVEAVLGGKPVPAKFAEAFG
jgi:peroxiredoxin